MVDKMDEMANPNYEYVKCNICSSDDYKIVFEPRYHLEKDRDLSKKFKSSGDETLIDQVVRCNKCGLIYINPRIKHDLILKGYSEGSDEAFVSQAKDREKTFNRGLKLIEKYADKGRIYDIGTAGGSFLSVAKNRGWEVYGSEPNKWCCDWAKKNYGIDIIPGDLFANKFQEGFFDVVTLWDVLEHVSDPKEYIKEVNRILKKDGIFIVNYPDVGSIIAKILGRKWMFWLSVHLYYFTKKTIKRILEEGGFKIIRIKPHFQTLSYGYLAKRSIEYSKILHKIMSFTGKYFFLNNIPISYYLGQSLVIAKKIDKK